MDFGTSLIIKVWHLSSHSQVRSEEAPSYFPQGLDELFAYSVCVSDGLRMQIADVVALAAVLSDVRPAHLMSLSLTRAFSSSSSAFRAVARHAAHLLFGAPRLR